MNGEIFEAYIEQFLVPELRPSDIAVMDNLSVHKMVSVRTHIENAGAKLLLLPPYSPDFSPIEPAWSKVKALLRRSAARTYDATRANCARTNGVWEDRPFIEAPCCRGTLRRTQA